MTPKFVVVNLSANKTLLGKKYGGKSIKNTILRRSNTTNPAFVPLRSSVLNGSNNDYSFIDICKGSREVLNRGRRDH